jgi:hypothetical protein
MMANGIYYIISLNILFFLTGYLFGKSGNSQAKNHGLLNNKNIQINKYSNQNSLSIDETKVVTKINTNGLEKKYDTISKEKQSTENISSAINKLKNIKG